MWSQSHNLITVTGHGEQERCLEKSQVTPVLKKGTKEDPGSIRPDSPSSIPGKVMEQLILNVISRQVEENKLTRRSQHGFSKGKSCQISLTGFGDGLSAWAEEGRAVVPVCPALSRALGTLP